MEATAVSVGKAVLDGALGYAKSKVAKEIVLQLGVERDFVFITDELQMMQSFLMTADEEQSQNKVLMTWVKQIGDLAYNVEDSLMDFSLHSDKKPFWGCIPRSPCDRRRIAKEVKELRAKVEDVSCRNLRYRLINENSGSKPVVAEEQANIASAAMFGINEARIAALEKEKSELDLYQLIASNNVDLKVIAVWGTAGDLGKTTAIQEVYDNPEVVSNFGFRAWVRLAHPFNPKEFLHSTVRQFYENSPGKLGDSRKWKTVGSKILMNMEDMTQSNITNEFDTQVNCSRYLIVIDNLSTISEWNCIKRFFPDNKKRSRIIISTQQAELASLCTEQPYQVSELKQLSSDQTLYVFHKNNSEEQVSMAEAGVAMLDINEPKLATAHKEKLKVSLRQLISDGVKDLRVIVVKETCGDLGNLSVIKEVYDDPTVNANFGLCAWVTLTRPFNPKEFIQSLIRQFKSSADELEDAEGITSFRDNNVLIKMEKRKPRDLDCVFDAQVRDNSYLFVINDVSTVEEWDCVKKYFLDYKKGSRIIVSTHQVEITSLCTEQTYQVLEMKQLSSDQILCTFHNKVTHESCSAESISDTKKVTTTEKNNATPTSEMQEDQQPESATEDKVCNSTARKKFYRNRTLALADEMFTGRITEKSFVIKLVCQPEQNEGCKVISVWGMGGLGKTTLVRSVYRSQELSSFKRAWATAMRPFNPEVLLRDITLQLQKSIQEDPAGATTTGAQTKSIGAMQLFELKQELSRLLNTQKCLIVLDDISSTFEWDLVNRSLGSAGIIIVTTREKNIAEHCSREYKNMYSLQGLKEDAALELFKKKVFKGSTEKYDFVPVMMEQARLILKKCHGLPLAISTIGGFLATKPKSAIEWRKMNDHISAELEINPELRSIKTVLMRSYDGLPFHLKFAFLYLSIFRECRIIRRNRLVKRWIAEGYSRERHGMTASEVGGNYFDELLDRSMILPAEGVDYFNEKIDACQLHDIIHQICTSKAREENLVFTLEEGGVSSTQGAIRHLVIGSNWKRDKDMLESMLDLSHVRSLTVFGEWEPFFISDNMRYLRVVDLEGTLGLRDHHLDKIGQLLHLKYLSLRGCRNIYYLPNSLGNLRHLQTLDVRGTRIFELPTTITKLRKLQHLRTTGDCLKTRDSLMGEHDIIGKYASRVTKSASSYALMVQTGPLFWRPQVLDDGLNRHDIWNIYRFVTVCLEEKGTIYGWLEGFEAPRGIGKLKSLHTLDLVNVARGKGKAILKELEGLTQLYKLGVAGISNENSKLFWSAIASHNQLRSLSVQGYPWRELDGCLGEDLSPPNFLRSLKLYGELVRLTKWIHQLQNLSKLILAYTHLEQDDAIQALGVLPNLAILRLMWGSFVGNQLHFQGPFFPSLMVLELNGLTDVKSVCFEERSVPRLELLQADWCWSLKEISGLPLLTSLQGVRLGYQISQELKEQVQSQLAEHPKLVSLDTNYVSSFSME